MRSLVAMLNRRSCISGVIAFWAFCAFIFLAQPSSALMRPLSTAELTTNSDSVLTGDVQDVRSSWDNTGKTIVTRTTVNVTEVVRGTVTTSQVEVESLGGTVGDTTLEVSDMLTFKKGQNVLIFLKRTKSKLGGDAYGVVGSAQGMYTVGEDGIARKGGFTILGTPPSSGTTGMSKAAVEAVIDNNIPVKDLITKIKAVK